VMFGNDSSRTGTRLYSPPEANLGKPATTGFDVYALGVMLFQMVVGDLHRPLGTGWQDTVLAGDEVDSVIQTTLISEDVTTIQTSIRRNVGDLVRATLLHDDITDATHSAPAKRLPSAAIFAQRLENLEERRRERLANIKRQEDERIAEIKRQEVERRALDRENRLHRLRWLTATIFIILLVVGALGIYAWQAKNGADNNYNTAIAQESEAKKQADIAKMNGEKAESARLKADIESAEARRQRDFADRGKKATLETVEHLSIGLQSTFVDENDFDKVTQSLIELIEYKLPKNPIVKVILNNESFKNDVKNKLKESFRPFTLMEKARTYLEKGKRMHDQGHSDIAVVIYKTIIFILPAVPSDPEERKMLNQTHQARAIAFEHLENYDDAMQDWISAKKYAPEDQQQELEERRAACASLKKKQLGSKN